VNFETVGGVASSPIIVRLPGRFLRAAWQGLVLLALSFACYYLISNYLLQSVRVVGSSMVPTLANSDSYLLNRWIYLVRDPRVSEVVVLKDPMDGGFSVKRVVAVPGDKVLIKGGKIFLNGAELHEAYLPPSTLTFTEHKEVSFVCSGSQFFVLGDNRNNSVDSRAYGPVPRKNILGMIVR